MKKLMSMIVVVMVSTTVLAAEDKLTFERPDCSNFEQESTCFKYMKGKYHEATREQMMKLGLVFVHYARPDWDSAPEDDKKAFDKVGEDKVEGVIEITYKVNTDGTTFDVNSQLSDDRLKVYLPYFVEAVENHKFRPREDVVTAPVARILFLHPADDDEEGPEKDDE